MPARHAPRLDFTRLPPLPGEALRFMNSALSPRILCFGEVLWDCLPGGRLPGGAPLNVAYHLHRLGADPVMLSAVGTDPLGEEMLSYLASRGLRTDFVTRHPTLPTGTVSVAVSAAGQPSYTIEQGVAWDDIAFSNSWRAAIAGSQAIVFGSLAARTAANRAALDDLLKTEGVLRVMDVNLRAPFDDRDRILGLARCADWIKLNEHELEALTGGLPESKGWPQGLLIMMEKLAALTGCQRICVTAGERGAFLRNGEVRVHASAPPIVVQDTIGAGDAFTAALVHGLLTRPTESLAILRRACELGALVASLPGGQPDYDASRLTS